MPYNSKQVANEFLELAKNDGKQLTPMQLQKLVYFAYGWYLAITGERLLDERVEAWQWGPVIPSLYSEFKRYGSDPITEPAYDYYADGLKIGYRPYRLSSDDPARDELARQVITRVWNLYGKYSGSALSSMTHAEDSPWSLSYDKDVRGTDISDDVIKRYFQQLAAQEHARPVAAG
ncbi:MAG TPA: type II toxin-antitoxin system antitoxin SocA domain-containing protein [Candidatus Sulfotelmatobacter sp.]